MLEKNRKTPTWCICWCIFMLCKAAGIAWIYNCWPYACDVAPVACVPAKLNGGGVPEWNDCFSYDWKINSHNLFSIFVASKDKKKKTKKNLHWLYLKRHGFCCHKLMTRCLSRYHLVEDSIYFVPSIADFRYLSKQSYCNLFVLFRRAQYRGNRKIKWKPLVKHVDRFDQIFLRFLWVFFMYCENVVGL